MLGIGSHTCKESCTTIVTCSVGILLSLCLSVSLRISLSPSVALVSLPGRYFQQYPIYVDEEKTFFKALGDLSAPAQVEKGGRYEGMRRERRRETVVWMYLNSV